MVWNTEPGDGQKRMQMYHGNVFRRVLMSEHNLPDKDDAPWLDTTYDGFNEDLALKSLGIDRETFGQKPWDENDLVSIPPKDFIKRLS
jgi:hypothetical protein